MLETFQNLLDISKEKTFSIILIVLNTNLNINRNFFTHQIISIFSFIPLKFL